MIVGTDYDAAEIDRDIIAQRLKEDVAETKGKVYKHVANSLTLRSVARPIYHKNPVTCVAVYESCLYTTSKNGVIEKWDIKDFRDSVRLTQINRQRDKKNFAGHTGDILSLAISGDGKFLATGGADKRICVWETSSMGHLKTFTQHRGPVMVYPLLV